MAVILDRNASVLGIKLTIIKSLGIRIIQNSHTRQQHRAVRSQISERDKKIDTYLALQSQKSRADEMDKQLTDPSKQLKRYHNE